MSDKLYRPINVWKADNGNRLILFRCFEVIGERKYCVQSCDFFSLPIDEKQILQLERQAMELFLESQPDERSEIYASLEDAIKMHEKEFFE